MIARGLLPLLLLVAASSEALAYSDPAAFAAPVLEAGGGGRFYTGSPAEGFGCESCHSGGEAPELRVEGLPARYAPRATYELRVSWSREIAHAAAALELTDDRGRGAGTLALPPAGEYIDEEQCEPREVGLLAAQLYPADRERTIAAAPDCGATALRVQWTAPAKDVGPVWFAGSVLVSDHAGDFAGDGARTFVQGIPPFGETLPPIVTTGSCSAVARTASARPGYAWLVGLALVFALRRRRSAWLALCLFSAACQSSWHDPRATSVERGRAVVPWNDAQLVVQPEDADSAVSDASSDASADDAAASHAALDAAMPEDEPFGTDAPCEFRVTTLPLGGRYAPKNVAAIWIERMDGTWVKTLAVWAGVRLRYLTAYRRANPTGNKVDAVTSATLQAFGPRVVGWNLADAQGQEVPDGDYVVKLEITDRDATGQTLTFPFGKPQPPFVVTLPDTQYSTSAQLRCR